LGSGGSVFDIEEMQECFDDQKLLHAALSDVKNDIGSSPLIGLKEICLFEKQMSKPLRNPNIAGIPSQDENWSSLHTQYVVRTTCGKRELQGMLPLNYRLRKEGSVESINLFTHYEIDSKAHHIGTIIDDQKRDYVRHSSACAFISLSLTKHT
jgi:hypothetical protein